MNWSNGNDVYTRCDKKQFDGVWCFSYEWEFLHQILHLCRTLKLTLKRPSRFFQIISVLTKLGRFKQTTNIRNYGTWVRFWTAIVVCLPHLVYNLKLFGMLHNKPPLSIILDLTQYVDDLAIDYMKPSAALYKPTNLSFLLTLLTIFATLSYDKGRLSYGGVSVCLSVRQTHAGIDSKLMIVWSCNFYHRVAQRLFFWHPTFIPYVPGEPRYEGFKRDWSG